MCFQLAGSYDQFKNKLHDYFQNVYDTKYMSLEIKKNIDRDGK